MNINENYDIVMTKWVAVKGTAILADKYLGALAGKLPASILERARGFSINTDTAPEEAVVKSINAFTFPVSDGGIFKALWDMSEAAATGIEINLKQMYIKQETVEICEIFDINPYMLNGKGSLLIITQHGNLVVRELNRHNICASVIGYTTDNNDRVIINDNDRRYLNPRICDELIKLDQHQ